MSSGPCVLCGAINYPPSMGGPMICPSCDCGDFGVAKIQRQAAELARLRAHVAALEADKAALTTALNNLVMVCGRTGESLEDFEEQAEAFQRDTGFLRPGKDMPAALGERSHHAERARRYAAWADGKIESARATLAAHGTKP